MLRLSLIISPLKYCFLYTVATDDTAIANVAVDAAARIIKNFKMRFSIKD